MANCQDQRLTGNECCCQHCLHDRITDPECCRCVPRRVCWTYQDDDEFERPLFKFLEHEEDGVYTPIEITEGAGPPYWVDLQLVKDESDECVWRLRKGTSVTFDTILQSYDFPISWPDTKCLTDNDLYAVAEDWNHFGNNGDVTININPYILVPVEEVSPGEFEPVCDSCNCFDACFCLEHHWDVTIPQPGKDEVINGSTRTVYVCFDEDVGVNGGWRYMFPLDTENEDCTFRHEIIIEIVKDENGNCKLAITDDLDYWDRVQYPDFYCGQGVFAQWEHELDEFTTVRIRATASNCTDLCTKPCCGIIPEVFSIPEELTGVLSGDDIPDGPYEFTLYRSRCGFPNYVGTVDIEWDCLSNPSVAEAGTGTFEVAIQCVGCQWNYVDEECQCDCDQSSNTLNGCWRLNSFDGLNFECTEPPPPGCTGGNPGGMVAGLRRFSRCTEAAPAVCSPMYAQWPVAIDGFSDCLSTFVLEVSEE